MSNFWKMQLHPGVSSRAAYWANQSLQKGFIGLDFERDVGNLLMRPAMKHMQNLPVGERRYWGFAHVMNSGDKVLIFAHHLPLALVTVDGPYNYISHGDYLGVWFRHFRHITDVLYYADWKVSLANWATILMTNTIEQITGPGNESRILIEQWITEQQSNSNQHFESDGGKTPEPPAKFP